MSAQNAKSHFRRAEKAAENDNTQEALREMAIGLKELADAVDDVERKVQSFDCRAR